MQLSLQASVKSLIGASPEFMQVLSLCELVAPTKVTVMLNGATGTGKELLAKHVHASSPRAKMPFVSVNCAAVPENLIESELFGFERGAFTGAIGQHIGRFERANTGTLFLDEVGDMSLSTQAKVLRVIQEREFERLGGNRTINVDVRFIAATNRNLQQMVRDGTFREDLYYRLNVFRVEIPPLRERPDDIDQLVEYFVAKFSEADNLDVKEVDGEALQKLRNYSWPGNVRELENVIQRAVLLADGDTIVAKNVVFESLTLDVREERHDKVMPTTQAASPVPQPQRRPAVTLERSAFMRDIQVPKIEMRPEGINLVEEMRRVRVTVETQIVAKALEMTRWNRTATAKLLGVSYKTLLNKMDECGLRKLTPQDPSE